MNAPDLVARMAGGEHGAVSALVALILPVLIVAASFGLDVSHWFEHQRHLQLQADAGVLAGGQEFQAQSCSDTRIENTARQYSGMSGGTTPVYNQLLSGATSVYENVNSSPYPAQPSPPPSDTTSFTGSPCNDEMLDLKLTETGLPWYFHVIGVSGGINAHARVSVLQQSSGNGFVPFAVNQTAPVAAKAYFIDESASSFTPLASVTLTRTGTNGQGQDIWSNATPLPVAISKPNVGVVIALSGDPNNTTCPSNSTFVNCFDLNPGPSLVHIQGYSTATAGSGSYAKPIARSVTLQAGTGATPCADGYFSNSTVDCTFGITANLDLGPTPNPPGVTVTAVMGKATYPLTYSGGTWTGTATLPNQTGSNQIDLLVKCDKGVPNAPCTTNSSATLSDVQRAYAASPTTSGTIASAFISCSSGTGCTTPGAADADSFALGSTPNLSVTIAVNGSLQPAQNSSAPLYVMRFGSGTSASQTGAVDCTEGNNGMLVTNIQNGCPGQFEVNCAVGTITPCINDPSCANVNSVSGSTPPPPADCVQTDTGVKTGQLKQGMAARMANAPCPSNWPTAPGAPLNIPPNDPRVVQVFVTAYGSFGASGNQNYPIQQFAAFYVTGWDGDTCASDDPAGTNQVVGHFISYVSPYNLGGGGNKLCIPNSLAECVVVLTR